MKIYLASTLTEAHQGRVLTKKKRFPTSVELLDFKGEKA